MSNVLGNLGIHAYLSGEWDEAVRLYEEATRYARRGGDVINAAMLEGLVAEVRIDQGRGAEVLSELRSAIATLRSSGFPDATFAEIQLARVLAGTGQLDDARAVAERCQAEQLETGRPVGALEAALVLAEILIRKGRPDEAVACLDAADEALREPASNWLPREMYLRSTALEALGDLNQALDLARGGYESALRLSNTYEAARLAILEARLHLGLGEPQDSPRVDEARDTLHRLGVEGDPSIGFAGNYRSVR